MRCFDRCRMAVLTLFHRGRRNRAAEERAGISLDQQVAGKYRSGYRPRTKLVTAASAYLRQSYPASRSGSLQLELELVWRSSSRDLRYGARTLKPFARFLPHSRFLVMALGIGATASLFTIVNAVLLKPLPFRDPGRLVMIYEHFRTATANSDGFNYNVVSAADFNDWRRQTHSFQDMAAWKWHGVNLTGEHGDLPENVLSSAGSWNLFSVLDVPMALGRAFTPQEDVPVGDQVVILTWSLYQRRFNGNPSVLGKHVLLNGVPHTIVGVLPRWFSYPSPQVQLWVPYAQPSPRRSTPTTTSMEAG